MAVLARAAPLPDPLGRPELVAIGTGAHGASAGGDPRKAACDLFSVRERHLGLRKLEPCIKHLLDQRSVRVGEVAWDQGVCITDLP